MSETQTKAPGAEAKTASKEPVTMRQLLECGVHFGHQTKRWNAKMKRYIFTSRNGIHVIDLQQTIKLVNKAYEFARDIAKARGTILFVGTKKQAQDAVEFEAARCQMPFVNHRWLGGTLTNNVTLRQSVNKLKSFSKMKEDGVFDQLSRKEASQKSKKLTRLEYYLNGIKDMIAMPSAIFIVDTNREQLAIREANRLGIPIIGVVDTNADPTQVQYPIPANDDAIRAIKLLCSVIANAVIDGQEQGVSQPLAKVEEEMVAKAEAAKAEESAGENAAPAPKAEPSAPKAKEAVKETATTTAKADADAKADAK